MTAAPPLHILILAAGASSRMRGRDKLTEEVGGQPLLRKIVEAALATGCPVTVALPPDRPARAAAIAGLAARTLVVPRPQDGMAASLVAGLQQVPQAAAVMLLLADLPEMEAADLACMVAAHAQTPDLILRATSDQGVPGHPVVFPAWLRAELLALTGDDGARTVVQAHKDSLRLIALPGSHATTDLDTPEAWAAWRDAQPG